MTFCKINDALSNLEELEIRRDNKPCPKCKSMMEFLDGMYICFGCNSEFPPDKTDYV